VKNFQTREAFGAAGANIDEKLQVGDRLAGILLSGQKIGPPAACEMRWGFAARVFKSRASFRADAF
jgi:hypothetical protein